MFIFTLLLWAAFFVLSEVLRPKPKTENARPASLGDFKFPTATEERVVPLIWGTVKLEGPNVVWYGDLRQVAITKKVKTGLFSSSRITTGYQYYLGVQMALSRGGVTPVGSLLRIWIGDTVVFNGNLNSDGAVTTINQPELFGGAELGSGGVVGDVRFYRGSLTQPVNAYIAQFQQQGGDTPAYRGTSYVALESVYLGNSTSIKPWKFELRRIPNGLGLATPTVNSGNDANPMNVLYEALTDTDWGLGFAPGEIDTDNFIEAADTLRTENNGFSFVLDNPIEVTELITEIERQIDGVVFLDRATGKWKVKLARGGYVVASLPSATPSNVLEVQDFTRGSWDDTTNQVRIQFTDRAKDYFGTYAMAQDMANVKLQGNVNISSTQSFPGVKDRNLANSIAWRNLRGLSYPLAKATLIVNRTFWNVNPGDVIRWTDPDLGFTDLVMRVNRIDLGRLAEGRITLNVVQDIYKFDVASFSPPPSSGWVKPASTAVDIPSTDRRVFEAPRAFVTRDPTSPGVLDRVWCGARYLGDGSVQFDVVTRPGSGSYTFAGEVAGFLLAGQLSAPLAANQTQGAASISLTPSPDSKSLLLQQLAAATQDDIGVNLNMLLLVDNEFIAFRNVADGGSVINLSNGYRGLLDSAPAAHANGARVWLLFVAGNLTERAFTPGDNVDVKLLPKSRFGQLLESAATAESLTMSNRGRRPYCPVNLTVNASAWPTSAANLDNQTGATLDTRGLNIGFTRRDFRTTDEAKAVLNESTLPADFPAANTTQYRVEVRNDPAGTNNLLFTTAYNGGTSPIFISRTEILRNMTGGAVPSNLRVTVQTRHTFEGATYTSLQNLVWDFPVSSTLLGGDFVFGVLASGASSASFSAPSTGTYTLNIGTALSSGAVQVNVNGGGFVNVITSGNTTGNFSANAGDSIVIRHNQSGAGTAHTFCELVFSGTSIAYAVLTY